MASPGSAYIVDPLMHSLWHINAPKCRTTGILIGGFFASAPASAAASAPATHCIIIIIIRLMDSCLQLQPGRQLTGNVIVICRSSQASSKVC